MERLLSQVGKLWALTMSYKDSTSMNIIQS